MNKRTAVGKARQREAARQRYGRLRAFLNSVKDRPYADCGLRWPVYVMQFDHVRGEKLFNISEFHNGSNRAGWSMELLQAEIDKCDIVCANCHFIRTHDRREANRQSALEPTLFDELA